MTTPSNPLNLILDRIDNIEAMLFDMYHNTGGKLPLKSGKNQTTGKKVQQLPHIKKSTKNTAQ